MAIFYRANALSKNIEKELSLNGIPYRVFGGMSFYSRKEIKDIIAYFKLTAD